MMKFVIDGKETEAIFIISELSRMDHIRRHLHCEQDNRVEALAAGRGGILVAMELVRGDYNQKTAYCPDTAPPNHPFANALQAPGYDSNIPEKDSQTDRSRAAIQYLSSRESRSDVPCLKELFCSG